VVTLASGALVTVNPDGTLDYDPNGAFDDLVNGQTADDSFDYQAFLPGSVAFDGAASFELSALDGTNGFVINGIDGGDRSGSSVSSSGDVNGDGFDDIIIGAPLGGSDGPSNTGASYIVFGRTKASRRISIQLISTAAMAS